MSSLPNEIWDLIFYYIDDRFLRDVSHVSKTFEYLSRRHIYWEITIFTGDDDFTEALEGRNEVMTRFDSHRYVQRLNITSEALLPICNDWWFRMRDQKHGLEPWQWCNSEFKDLSEQDFAQLSDFVKKLPQLRHLHWNLHERIPPDIVRDLDHRRRLCHLHLHSFRLNSLTNEAEDGCHLSADDLALATSRSLTTIKFWRYIQDKHELMGYALREIMAGTAPNLEAVSYMTRGPILDPAVRARWVAGTVRSQLTRPKPNKGALIHLDIGGWGAEQEFVEWPDLTDFTKLKSLAFWLTIDASMVNYLKGIRFDSLEHLKISTLSPGYVELILSLKPLTELQLRHAIDAESLRSILQHSGSALRLLRLDKTYLDLNNIEHIRTHCPNLEQLAAHVWRRRGAVEEVAIYKAIGRLPKLHTVQLSMDQPDDIDAAANDDRQSISILQNIAMDEELATAIFKAMASSKLPYSRPLEILQFVVDAVHFREEETVLRNLIVYVGRSWTCCYDPQSPTECTTEMFFERDFDCANEEDEDWKKRFEDIMKTSLGAALLETWPKEPDSEELLNWHSLPLQTEEVVHRSAMNKESKPRSFGSRMLGYCSSLFSWGLGKMTSYSSANSI